MTARESNDRWDEIREAIPPVMTEHIGRHLMAELRARVAA